MSRASAVILGSFVSITTCAGVTYMVIFAVTITSNHSRLRILSIVAAVTNLLALALALTLVPVFAFNHTSKRRRLSIFMLGITLSFVATVMTTATLGCMKMRLHSLPRSIFGSPTSSILTSGFGILGASILAQAAFYSFLLWSLRVIGKRGHQHGSWNSLERGVGVQQLVKAMVRPAPELSWPPLTRSATPSDAKRTLRSSLSSVVRPVISRTKLVNRDSTSLDSGSRDDMPEHGGFDSWDTSGVGSQTRQAVLISSSLNDVEHFSVGVELEPIPGSRPGSPASRPPSESGSDSVNTRGLSDSPRSRSQSLREAHIHPLFRSDSPTPPPTASPGTVVRASPLGGQVFNGSIQSLKQARSGVFTLNASPLVRSQSFDGETATQRPSSIEIPPPLRDFILPPSPRSNPTTPSGHSRRKAALAQTAKEPADLPCN
ncbi:MAG: hypothetical protein M1839_005068 [Geoglossum umbratile]|nr:MAG: hypothetical protein M1839_005068 [Geoglossum umbratile]